MNRSGNIFFCLCAALLLVVGNGRAETVFWSDNFDNAGAGSRWTSSSVWRIGSPTIGPAINSAGYRTHSGANCATTGLKSNYPYNADARLVCINYNGASSFVVPSADEFPRLRFWHWFNFVNALGYVEISTNAGSSWQQISPNYLDMSSSGVWSPPSLDLRPFAGQSVRIAFHFSSGSGGGTAPGWYVDDVAVVTDEPVFNNPEGFESGLGDWSVDSGTWEIGKPTAGPSKAHGGTNCAATVLSGKYGPNVDSRLISPPFPVPSNSPALRFWHWYNFPTVSDALGYVEISTDAGSSWQQISINYILGHTGSNGTNVSLDLSAYAGQTVQAAFHFTSLNGGSAGKGWYVDDVSLMAAPVVTVPDTQTIYAGQTLAVTFSANNSFLPDSTFIFSLPSPSTNYWITTDGVLTWTNTGIKNGVLTWTNNSVSPGTRTIPVKVTDNSNPPLLSTNSFELVFLPPLPPTLTVPTNQTIYVGRTFTVTNSATNIVLTNAIYTFKLPSPSTNVWITTNGVLAWTNTAVPPGTNLVSVKVTDNSVPPLSATNSFKVIVTPSPPVLIVSNLLTSSHSFQFSFHTLSNTTWRIDASTNLSSWLPLLTNTVGPSGMIQFTDLLATNYPWRFYRAVLQ